MAVSSMELELTIVIINTIIDIHNINVNEIIKGILKDRLFIFIIIKPY